MELFVDLLNLIFTFLALCGTIILVLRTEKELDLAAKMFFFTALTLFIFSVFKLDLKVGIISNHYNESLFYISRLAAMVFFLGGVYFLVNMTKKNLKK